MTEELKNKSVFLTEEAEAVARWNDEVDEYFSKKVNDMGAKSYTNNVGYNTQGGTVTQHHYTGNGTKALTPTCKHTGEFAFSTPDGVCFYGATGWCADLSDIDVVFDLAGAISETRRKGTAPIKSGPPEIMRLNEFMQKSPIFVDLNWPDFGVLNYVGHKFWEGVADWLVEVNAQHVLVTCTGGNGRTGTFLAIMNGIYNDMSAERSIASIRTVYCSHAVETSGQEDYVKKVLEKVI